MLKADSFCIVLKSKRQIKSKPRMWRSVLKYCVLTLLTKKKTKIIKNKEILLFLDPSFQKVRKTKSEGLSGSDLTPACKQDRLFQKVKQFFNVSILNKILQFYINKQTNNLHQGQSLKEKGIVINKNHLFHLSTKNMISLLQDFYHYILPNKENPLTSSTKSSFYSTMKHKQKTSLVIDSVVSQKIEIKKMNKMQYNYQIYDFFLKFQQMRYEKQVFWKIIQKFQRTENNQQQLTFLLQKLKYITEQIDGKTTLLKQKLSHLQDLQLNIGQKTDTLAHLQHQINQKNSILNQINIKKKQFDQYLVTQPNKILEEQAKQYKLKQQELFDIAYMLEESTPETVITWIGGMTNVSDKCFHIHLNQFFSNISLKEQSFSFSRTELEKFKSNLQFSYEKVTSKMQEVIRSRFERIKQFVTIMQKLASYTVGKREYLDGLNEQMCVIKVEVQRQLEKIESQVLNLDNIDSLKIFNLSEKIKNMRKLVTKIEDLYMKAEVFY